MQPERLAFLRQSQQELRRQLQDANTAFSAELRHLREGIAMAHELLAGEVNLAEEEVRSLLKHVIETHPRGARAAELLTEIERLEGRLRDLAEMLGKSF